MPNFPGKRSLRLPAFVALAVLVAVGGILCFRRTGGGRRPNIILVVWDTCRGDRVSVNGYSRPTTPWLEGLASRGVTFRRCYTPAPWTPPAHGSLFTGLLPRAHGLVEGRGDRIRPGIPILPRTLRAAGYETVCISANSNISAATGLLSGFEEDLPCYRMEDQSVTGEAALERVRAWVAARKAGGAGDRPVFLFVNLMDTHLPYTFEAGSVAAVRGDAAVNGARRAAETIGNQEARAYTFGQRKIEDPSIRDLGAAYDGAVRVDDRLTGAILGLLEGAGLAEGAFVAVCGDHGENLGEHGELYHAFSVYDPVLHVPLVVRWPGRFEGGRVVEEQVRLQDLYPTILEAAGVPVPAPCGKDAVSLAEEPLRPRTVVSEFGPMKASLPELRAELPEAPAEILDRVSCIFRAVRDPASAPGGRKLVSVFHVQPGEEPVLLREELYDPVADPGETRNLLTPACPPAERAAADRLRSAGHVGR
jgi:arylsulfatase A-like enzyme